MADRSSRRPKRQVVSETVWSARPRASSRHGPAYYDDHRRGHEGVTMSKRIGFGDYQYELVEDWPKVPIDGGVADVACDSQGRVYAGVRDRQPDGKPGNIMGGGGHVLVLDRDGNVVATWDHVASAPHGVWVNQAGE